MEHCVGIKGTVLECFRSYLSGRSFWYRPCDGELTTGSSSTDVWRSHNRPYRERERERSQSLCLLMHSYAAASFYSRWFQRCYCMLWVCSQNAAGGLRHWCLILRVSGLLSAIVLMRIDKNIIYSKTACIFWKKRKKSDLYIFLGISISLISMSLNIENIIVGALSG